ncbi:MAG: GIY-YIG nuclease family protein [Nodosilinea sp. WJT8-NPBG4]|jgi:group I intron endonuclease|nr:GIY-YIG nuclease family protein [Nodosilinea sp. WJT8-NPBG4]
MTRGVYTICCVPTGKVYVGSSKNIESRWIRHKRDLKKNRHHSKNLQDAWNKYSETDFKFCIVEEVIDGNLLEFEYRWTRKLDAYKIGFNSSPFIQRPTIVYYLEVTKNGNTVYKVGKTQQSIEKRFEEDTCEIKVLGLVKMANKADATWFIQYILTKYEEFKYDGSDLLISGNTQLFSKDIFNLSSKFSNNPDNLECIIKEYIKKTRKKPNIVGRQLSEYEKSLKPRVWRSHMAGSPKELLEKYGIIELCRDYSDRKRS